jgi:hypothetical protein
MAYDGAFSPWGNTVLVGATIKQVKSKQGTQAPNYRIRCLVAGYIAWSTAQVATVPPTFTVAAPTAAVDAPNTFGMAVGQVEVFNLANDAYFLSSVDAGFEVTAGEGL